MADISPINELELLADEQQRTHRPNRSRKGDPWELAPKKRIAEKIASDPDRYFGALADEVFYRVRTKQINAGNKFFAQLNEIRQLKFDPWSEAHLPIVIYTVDEETGDTVKEDVCIRSLTIADIDSWWRRKAKKAKDNFDSEMEKVHMAQGLIVEMRKDRLVTAGDWMDKYFPQEQIG